MVKFADFVVTKVIDQNGQYHEQVKISDAKRMAQEAGLDLVCFSRANQNSSALCKIIDYGKWKYIEEKKKKKQNKGGKKETKEIRLSPVISDHDVEHKLKQVVEFLENGDDVILAMKIKGRQRVHFDYAEQRMNDVVGKCTCGKEVSRKKNPGLITVRIIHKPKEEMVI